MGTVASVLDQPTYQPATAARLVGLSPNRVRRWLRGYEYTYALSSSGEKRRSRKKPIVRRQGTKGSNFASFLDLIDLLFAKSFVDHGLTLQKLRAALSEADKYLGEVHFAQREFWTDGRDIYLRLPENADALLQLLHGGQWAIAPVIMEFAKQIEFDKSTGFASRWYPLKGNRDIIIDPRIAFGAPSIRGHGVETATVYDFYSAEGNDIHSTSTWLGISKSAARSAVEFERRLATA